MVAGHLSLLIRESVDSMWGCHGHSYSVTQTQDLKVSKYYKLSYAHNLHIRLFCSQQDRLTRKSIAEVLQEISETTKLFIFFLSISTLPVVFFYHERAAFSARTSTMPQNLCNFIGFQEQGTPAPALELDAIFFYCAHAQT